MDHEQRPGASPYISAPPQSATMGCFVLRLACMALCDACFFHSCLFLSITRVRVTALPRVRLSFGGWSSVWLRRCRLTRLLGALG